MTEEEGDSRDIVVEEEEEEERCYNGQVETHEISPADLSPTVKRMTSASVFLTQFASGCTFTILAPTVIRFSQTLDVDVATISFIFTVRTVAYLISALSCGVLYTWCNRPMCVIFLTAFVSASLFLLPIVTSLHTFLLLGVLMGVGSAGYDTAQIALIIEMWGDKADPYILTQHFSYSFGTVITPLILSPFLRDDEVTSKLYHNNFMSLHIPSLSSSSADSLFIPFAIVGSLMALAVLSQVLVFFKMTLCQSTRHHPLTPDISDTSPIINAEEQPDRTRNGDATSRIQINGGTSANLEDSANSASSANKWRTWILTALAAASIGFYSGIELTSMQFFPTFCTYAKVALSEAQGAQILFGLTMAFAIGRLVGIPLVVLKVPPQFIVYTNCVLIVMANVILYVWGQESVQLLWVGSVLLGGGISTVYPSIYAFIQRHLKITNWIVALITVSGGGVSSIYPIIVGQYVETNPSVLNYVIFFSISVLIVCFAALHWTAARVPGR